MGSQAKPHLLAQGHQVVMILKKHLVSPSLCLQVVDQGIPKDSTASFMLRAKFYPEDVSQLVMEVTLHFFYMQVSIYYLCGWCPCIPYMLPLYFCANSVHIMCFIIEVRMIVFMCVCVCKTLYIFIYFVCHDWKISLPIRLFINCCSNSMCTCINVHV